jgi:hypothetical protein
MKIEMFTWKREYFCYHPSYIFPFPNDPFKCRSIDAHTKSTLISVHTQLRYHSVIIFCLHVFLIILERLNYITHYFSCCFIQLLTLCSLMHERRKRVKDSGKKENSLA